MRIAVCLKQVVAREWPVRVRAPGNWVHDDLATWELNEPDAYALEEALRLKETHGGEVLAVSAGPSRVEHVLRDALARGADRATRVAGGHLAVSDASTTARALASAIRDEAVDLVLTGLQSDDQGFAQVGVILAEDLGTAHATLVRAIEVDGANVRIKRELEGGWFQWVRMPLPAVLTIQSGINQLRYATLKGIMAARRRALQVVEAPQGADGALRIVSVAVPDRAGHARMIAGAPGDAARELMRALRDEARVV